MSKIVSKKRIFVGLSGGVDSSVSAALLQAEGHDVTGVFIKVWQPDFLPCTWQEDRRDAMRVCAHLGIPFLTLDLTDVYKHDVVDYMISEYRCGRTPNPDVMCNKSVKFGAYLEWARKKGADAIATGHYAQILSAHPSSLGTSSDREKDQTYFLWTLQTKDLQRILFPVGNLCKEETRKLARKFNLPTAQKKDSQGLCFLGKLDMKDFLSHFIDTEEGNVVTTEGKEIGTHKGALLYTLGERHGFTITEKGLHTPLYVVAKDTEKNLLIVSSEPRVLTNSPKEVVLSNTNWIGGVPQKDTEYLARMRYRGELLPVEVQLDSDDTARIIFKGDPPLLSRGQSLVLYEEGEGDSSIQRCVGGGIME